MNAVIVLKLPLGLAQLDKCRSAEPLVLSLAPVSLRIGDIVRDVVGEFQLKSPNQCWKFSLRDKKIFSVYNLQLKTDKKVLLLLV